jgi:hypothetical protein
MFGKKTKKLSKKDLLKNLEQIKSLCKEESPIIASVRLEWLIDEVKNEKKIV